MSVQERVRLCRLIDQMERQKEYSKRLGFAITGALLKACLWLFILLPIGLVLCVLGLALCCTLILIPIGAKLFTAGLHVILPG